MSLLSEAQSIPNFPERAADAHKGTVGRVLVVAGSPGMSGAAYLCAQAALRSGAGIVTIACPESIHSALEIKTSSVMTRAIPDREGVFGPWSGAVLDKLWVKYDALAIGPGLGQHPATVHFFRQWIPKVSVIKPTVVDADALNALADSPKVTMALGPRVVLTPHPGELRRWLGCSTADVKNHRDSQRRQV